MTEFQKVLFALLYCQYAGSGGAGLILEAEEIVLGGKPIPDWLAKIIAQLG